MVWNWHTLGLHASLKVINNLLAFTSASIPRPSVCRAVHVVPYIAIESNHFPVQVAFQIDSGSGVLSKNPTNVGVEITKQARVHDIKTANKAMASKDRFVLIILVFWLQVRVDCDGRFGRRAQVGNL